MFDGSSNLEPLSAAASPDAELVDKLTSHHRTLIDIYQEIHDAVTAGRLHAVGHHAKEFHDRLHLHLQTENLGFYLKLNRQFQKTDVQQRRTIHELQRQIHLVGTRALDFTWKARLMKLSVENSSRFRADLEQVGSLLVARIRKEEEELYPLYLRLFS